jgi:hypothetical protein
MELPKGLPAPVGMFVLKGASGPVVAAEAATHVAARTAAVVVIAFMMIYFGKFMDC